MKDLKSCAASLLPLSAALALTLPGSWRWATVILAFGILPILELWSPASDNNPAPDHSDHHFKATRKYQILRHLDESPQLPFGYPTCMLIAVLPPLWFRLMNPILDQQHAHRPHAAA